MKRSNLIYMMQLLLQHIIFLVLVVVVVVVPGEGDDIDEYCERICNSLSGNRDHYFSCLYGCRAGFDKRNETTCDKEEEKIRERFEMFPFGRDVDEDEMDDLQGVTDFDMINHYCWKGKRDVCSVRDTPFRILILGGGTGSSTASFISTMIERKVPLWEVYYLDISERALSLTRKRLERRNLFVPSFVKLIRGSLENVRDYIPANIQFDFIEAVGVIHHMSRPEIGMRAIRDLLKKNGCANVMLYGTWCLSASLSSFKYEY